MKKTKNKKAAPEAEVVIEIKRIDLNVNPKEKGKTLGCWGPSPDDNMNQC